MGNLIFSVIVIRYLTFGLSGIFLAGFPLSLFARFPFEPRACDNYGLKISALGKAMRKNSIKKVRPPFIFLSNAPAKLYFVTEGLSCTTKGEGMFKIFWFAAAAASCFLLVHCAGTGVKIMPEYKNINVEKSKLGIILLKENLLLRNPNDIAYYLGGGKTKEVFHDFFTSQLRAFAKKDGKFADVGVVNDCDTSGFTKRTQFLSSDDSVQVRVPSIKAFMGDSLPFLLILDYFKVSRDQKSGTTMVSMGPNGTMRTIRVGAYDNLVLTGTFVLWDNLAGKIVSFGKINEKTSVILSMTKQTWITTVKSISEKIFINTPYGKWTAPQV
jgi:hypothetical protein